MSTVYVFVNTDLKMTPGKIASQVEHVIRKLTDKIIYGFYQYIIDIKNIVIIKNIQNNQ